MKLTTALWISLPLVTLAAPARGDSTQDMLQRVSAVGLVEQVLGENPLLAGWEDAVLTSSWLYYDPIGQPLFYEVEVEVNGEPAGRMKIGANAYLGTTVLSVESTPRPWSLITAVWASAAFVQGAHPDATILTGILVGYDGLKTGVVIFYDEPGQGIGFEVYDLSTLQLIPLPYIRSTLAAIPVIEYQQRWDSFLEDLLYVIEVDDLAMAEGLELAKVFAAPFDANDWNILEQVPGAQLTDEPHVMVDISRCKYIAQEEGDWCARAMLQMFNHYYKGGTIHTQTQIDSILNSWGWDTAWTFATTLYLWIYTGQSDSGFNAVTIKTPTATVWPKLAGEIDNDRPFGLYSSPGPYAHISMDVGYQVTNKELPSGSVILGGDSTITEYWLHVYDPATGMISVKAWKENIMTYPGNIGGWFHARP